jgi:methylmalonyl-CoA/ethylmalonyl-CoA epimerase
MACLAHVAVVVRDLEAALRVYRDALALPLDRVEELPDRGLRVAFLALGGGAHLELIQPLRDDSEVSAFLAKRGEGLHHIALAVDDLASALDGVSEAGLSPLPGAGRPGAGGHPVAFLHPRSTNGVLVELSGQGVGSD